MATSDELLIEQVLDEIERREVRRLVWGLVDGVLTDIELRELVSPLLDTALGSEAEISFHSETDVIEHLVREGIVHRVPGGMGYRSRMAEGVRLFFRLRQLLPKHEGNSRWMTAPTLVADYRLIWRRRRYPKRDWNVARALERCRGTLSQDPILKQVTENRLARVPETFLLAAFQVEATNRILDSLVRSRQEGTLISAGTGSGKTLAFYLPALAWVASRITANGGRRVSVLAVYPRNELLKDQFSEIYRQAREFNAVLRAQGRRPICIGALYGDVPTRAKAVSGYGDGKPIWRPVGTGFLCPYLRCPECGGPVVWSAEDIAMELERLRCAECGHETSGDEVAISRARMQANPPDVLFTTSEMLNRRMSDSQTRHLFGIGPRATRGPDLVLLDEVHIYGGAFGAQIAYLLRRWRSQVTSKVHFVGLSATLQSGGPFFAKLVGLPERDVVEIVPREADLKSEGAEYMLALRGDPVSRRALLSTTIQTIMLAGRLLDPPDQAERRRLFGWRTFVFTDQMDSVNRLLAKARDAEGRQERSGNANVVRHPLGGLARLRRSTGSRACYEGGQDWQFLEDAVGHQLTDRLRISRTTSMDRGVDADSEVILATAALEVGFDAPQVGAVIQHKAPRDAASFLQRKGRAGRTRGIRPWTIVVLSDYGRDRVAYQAYEQLFDPELPPRSVPLQNRYIQRIHATYALLEFLANRLPGDSPDGSVWDDLTAPYWLESPDTKSTLERLWAESAAALPLSRAARWALGEKGKNQINDQRAKWWLVRRERHALLEQVLRKFGTDPALPEVSRAIQRSLGLTDADTRSALWEYPRPLALDVIPTAFRRLATGWRAVGEEEADYIGSSPLPDFAPGQLFSDLNLPEVELSLPATGRSQRSPGRRTFLPVLQALTEFAPGKVSWRYDEALWVVPSIADDSIAQCALDIQSAFQCEYLEPFPLDNTSATDFVPALRPRVINLEPLSTGQFQDTSNARLRWHSQIVAQTDGVVFDVVATQPAASLIERVRIHSHSQHSSVLIRRLASASLASLRRRGVSESHDVQLDFEWNGRPCVVGFEFEADGIVFELTIPDDLAAVVNSAPATRRALRTAKFLHEACHGTYLAELVANSFQREWLASIFLTAVTLDAIEFGRTLKESVQAVTDGHGIIPVAAVLDVIFQSPQTSDEELSQDDTEDRLRADLEQLVTKVPVLNALGKAAGSLWEAIDESWNPWLGEIAKATLGGALAATVSAICPDLDPTGIVVDLDPGPRHDGDPYRSVPRTAQIWITETSPGGNGLLEQFAVRFFESPRRFFEILEASVRANEYEMTDHQLRHVVGLLGGGSVDRELVDAVTNVRTAPGTNALEQSFDKLRRVLSERGFTLFHGFTSSLSARLLRPGTPSGLDEFLASTLEFWDEIERDLDVEVDSRTIAYLASRSDTIDQLLISSGMELPSDNRPHWRCNAIYALLWPRGAVIREAGVGLYNPYVLERGRLERLLIEAIIEEPEAPIEAGQPGWTGVFHEALHSAGVATLSTMAATADVMSTVLNQVALQPVQLDYLNIYPRLCRVTRREEKLFLRFELEELL